MNGRFGPGWGMAGMGLAALLTFLVLAALAATVVVLLVRLNKTRASAPVGAAARPGAAPTSAPHATDALAILDERLARGDIDVSDYEARRRALIGGAAPGASETRVDPLG